jgi:hypothetical protein
MNLLTGSSDDGDDYTLADDRGLDQGSSWYCADSKTVIKMSWEEINVHSQRNNDALVDKRSVADVAQSRPTGW